MHPILRVTRRIESAVCRHPFAVRALLGIAALTLLSASPAIVSPGAPQATVVSSLHRVRLALEITLRDSTRTSDSLEVSVWERNTGERQEWTLAFSRTIELEIMVPAGEYRVQVTDREGRRGAFSVEVSGDAAVTQEVRESLRLDWPRAAAKMSGPPPRPDLQPVFFATDRAPNPAADEPRKWFLNERGTALSYGSCVVSFPPDHKRGEIERPDWWKWKVTLDPRKHVMIQSGVLTPRTEFLAGINEELSHRTLKRLMLFVHGYNTDFEFAVLTAAQLSHDLVYEGAPVLYSWPSLHQIAMYKADQAMADSSVERFEQLLEDLCTHVNADRIELVAHSMGNRIVTAALANLRDRGVIPGMVKVSELVCAAPDVDADLFRQFAERTPAPASRVTLYGSSRDKAIGASRNLNHAARAGDGGKRILVIPGVETIDVSQLKTDFLDHSYVSENTSVISDLDKVLRGADVSQRCCLDSLRREGKLYWKFRKP